MSSNQSDDKFDGGEPELPGLAREFHDHFGQLITALSIQIHIFLDREWPEEADRQQATEILCTMSQLKEEFHRQMRKLTSDPPE